MVGFVGGRYTPKSRIHFFWGKSIWLDDSKQRRRKITWFSFFGVGGDSWRAFGWTVDELVGFGRELELGWWEGGELDGNAMDMDSLCLSVCFIYLSIYLGTSVLYTVCCAWIDELPKTFLYCWDVSVWMSCGFGYRCDWVCELAFSCKFVTLLCFASSPKS